MHRRCRCSIPSNKETTHSSYRVRCSQFLGKVKSKVKVFFPSIPPGPPTQSWVELGMHATHSPSRSVFSKLKRGRTRTATRTLQPAGGPIALSQANTCSTSLGLRPNQCSGLLRCTRVQHYEFVLFIGSPCYFLWPFE